MGHHHESEAPADQPTLLRSGPMAAVMTPPRDLFKVALLADANAIAVVRGEPSEEVAMSKHDHRVLKRFGETAGWLGIEFVDCLIVSHQQRLTKAPLPFVECSLQALLGR